MRASGAAFTRTRMSPGRSWRAILFSGIYLFRRGCAGRAPPWRGGADLSVQHRLKNQRAAGSNGIPAGGGARISRHAQARAAGGVLTICVFALATVGTVLFEPLLDLREAVSPERPTPAAPNSGNSLLSISPSGHGPGSALKASGSRRKSISANQTASLNGTCAARCMGITAMSTSR